MEFTCRNNKVQKVLCLILCVLITCFVWLGQYQEAHAIPFIIPAAWGLSELAQLVLYGLGVAGCTYVAANDVPKDLGKVKTLYEDFCNWAISIGRGDEITGSVSVDKNEVLMSNIFYDYYNYLKSANKTSIYVNGDMLLWSGKVVIDSITEMSMELLSTNHMEYSRKFKVSKTRIYSSQQSEGASATLNTYLQVIDRVTGALVYEYELAATGLGIKALYNKYKIDVNNYNLTIYNPSGIKVKDITMPITQNVDVRLTFKCTENTGMRMEPEWKLMAEGGQAYGTGVEYNDLMDTRVERGDTIKVKETALNEFPVTVDKPHIVESIEQVIPKGSVTNTVTYRNNWTGAFKDCVPGMGTYTFTGTGTITGDMDLSRVGTWEGTWGWTATGARTWTGTYTAADGLTWTGTAAETSTSLDTSGDINFEPLKVAGNLFTTKFPFSLPWDLLRTVKLLLIDSPDPPSWDIKWRDEILGKDLGFTIDLKKFDGIFKIARAFILVALIVGLIFGTRKLLGGAT
ncbi:MAG: hypothetical protein N3I35_04760 [Clostridia bacterium]|nr:hypothetical protein [Clostridia bacterium]